MFHWAEFSCSFVSLEKRPRSTKLLLEKTHPAHLHKSYWLIPICKLFCFLRFQALLCFLNCLFVLFTWRINFYAFNSDSFSIVLRSESRFSIIAWAPCWTKPTWLWSLKSLLFLLGCPSFYLFIKRSLIAPQTRPIIWFHYSHCHPL